MDARTKQEGPKITGGPTHCFSRISKLDETGQRLPPDMIDEGAQRRRED